MKERKEQVFVGYERDKKGHCRFSNVNMNGKVSPLWFVAYHLGVVVGSLDPLPSGVCGHEGPLRKVLDRLGRGELCREMALLCWSGLEEGVELEGDNGPGVKPQGPRVVTEVAQQVWGVEETNLEHGRAMMAMEKSSFMSPPKCILIRLCLMT